jgi:hypothetical protein
MRASLYLIGFAAASIVGAGAAEIGCSSSSSGGTTPPVEDAAVTDAPATVVDSGGGGGDSSATCTASPIDTETFDSGSPAWACEQAMCTTSLTACAANCFCNAAITQALTCSEVDGSAGAINDCFTTALTSLTNTDPTDQQTVATCLVATTDTCNPTSEAGSKEAGPTEAGPADAGGGG